MNNLPRLIITPVFLILTALALPIARAQAAARVYFSPTTVSVSQNSTFQIQVKVDAESNQVIGSDAVVSFAGADLTVTAVANGGYFPEFNSANNTSGRIEIHGYVSSIYQSKTGAGTLATVTFRSKKSSGSSAISFTCAGSGSDTNLINTSGQNILSCSQVNTVAVSYTSGGATNTPTPTNAPGGTNTPTPTNAPGVTNTPTPTNAPGGTNTAPYCTGLTTDITTATGTPKAVSFTCAGVDPGGLIMAAEFIFGDGTSQVVEKNVGSPGSISTTHTYTTIGSLGASCRVRDNDRVFSPATDTCKRIITIRPATGGTSVKTYKTVTPTPTEAVLSIIEETPEPTITPEETPPLYPEETLVEGEGGASRFWWIVGGATSLILAFILLRRRNRPPSSAGGPPIPPTNPPIPTAPPAPSAPPTPPGPEQHPV